MKTLSALILSAVIAVTLTLSSCLDNKGENITTRIDFLKVNNQMGNYTFMDPYGFTLHPSNQNEITVPITTKYAIVQYQYDPTIDRQGSTSLEVKVVQYGEIEDHELTPSESAIKSNSNTIINSSQGSPIFFDKNNIFVPLTYLVTQSNNREELNTELAKHNFDFTYPANGYTTDTLSIKLTHQVTDPDNTNRSINYTSWNHLDLTSVLQLYKQSKGTTPQYFAIEYEISDSTPNNFRTERFTIKYPQ